MTDRLRYFRLSLIVLAAVLGTLSLGSDVSASNSALPDRADACCVKRSCTVCCCPASKRASRRETTPRPTVVVSAGAGITLPPASPCVCRSDEPASPAHAPGPEFRSDDQRSDKSRGETLAMTLDLSPFIPASRIVLPIASHFTALLSLRTTRFLI